ncbi:hypothetical protein QRD02_07980 [Aequorivita sp. SDUM287046]|uniref:Uncharacterized protein n=1 Tax=Aequorivita aurantiaca TaxID=3053356 RepID=A0ABT8DHU5_9FLAO|nr:hypothetical protein [Aequorivita aurantiaca]MDN3724319.1 hypothetical protein [Aequorivita aurantiaca]
MIRYFLISVALLFSSNIISQNSNLSDYSYVVVPEQYDFLKGRDQFQINSMTHFYLEKYGFNAFMADQAPNANRCDGLFANVEKISTIFGTKLQVVLKDCNDKEIYRSQEGKSKFKEFDKSYQDALRKAFISLKAMNVDQKEVVLLANNFAKPESEKEVQQQSSGASKPIILPKNESLLPDAKFSNYSSAGKTYLLRKTAEGYSLYEESVAAADGLVLVGKIIVMEKVVKFMDVSGNVANATFDASGNLVITANGSSTTYQIED